MVDRPGNNYGAGFWFALLVGIIGLVGVLAVAGGGMQP